MPKVRSKRSKKRTFHGNRYTTAKNEVSDLPVDNVTASSKKLQIPEENVLIEEINDLRGNRIIDLMILISVFSSLRCPECCEKGLILKEDSLFGLCSNFCLYCKCGYMKGFCSTSKKGKSSTLNSLLVFGLRLIGKGYVAGKKLLSTLHLPYLSKVAFQQQECKLFKAVQEVSMKNMQGAATEVKNIKTNLKCGVSVDGTWQRRGHTSFNGCVSAISIDTGKVLDLEIMSQYCRLCQINVDRDHVCSNHKGSSGSMEVTGACRIFKRSEKNHGLQYTEYYGDGDSKGYMAVKDVYGQDSVMKLECIGHVQKRVGTRLRKLKKEKKGLGGKGKLTDKFIDKLQNYYGIAIRSNTGNLKAMQSAVIAAFFHCCSSEEKQMHGQCPAGPDSWCKFQRGVCEGRKISDKSSGLPQKLMNIVKPTYLSLCDQALLVKCLHGMTQNNNESFNNVLWTIVPKRVFVGMHTLLLGAHIATIIFNSGFSGLLPIFEALGIPTQRDLKENYSKFDAERIASSKRFSLPSAKVARKKRKAARKSKVTKCETKEGPSYKCGEF